MDTSGLIGHAKALLEPTFLSNLKQMSTRIQAVEVGIKESCTVVTLLAGCRIWLVGIVDWEER